MPVLVTSVEDNSMMEPVHVSFPPNDTMPKTYDVDLSIVSSDDSDDLLSFCPNDDWMKHSMNDSTDDSLSPPTPMELEPLSVNAESNGIDETTSQRLLGFLFEATNVVSPCRFNTNRYDQHDRCSHPLVQAADTTTMDTATAKDKPGIIKDDHDHRGGLVNDMTAPAVQSNGLVKLDDSVTAQIRMNLKDLKVATKQSGKQQQQQQQPRFSRKSSNGNDTNKSKNKTPVTTTSSKKTKKAKTSGKKDNEDEKGQPVKPCPSTLPFYNKLRDTDIICGRSTRQIEHHTGNKWFRRLVKDFEGEYRQCRKTSEKQVVVDKFIDAVKSKRGRFVEKRVLLPGSNVLIKSVERERYPKGTKKVFVEADVSVYDEKIKKALRRRRRHQKQTAQDCFAGSTNSNGKEGNTGPAVHSDMNVLSMQLSDLVEKSSEIGENHMDTYSAVTIDSQVDSQAPQSGQETDKDDETMMIPSQPLAMQTIETSEQVGVPGRRVSLGDETADLVTSAAV